MNRFRPAADAPARRVILLGASNLTKSIGTVLATSNGLWGGPLEVYAALGHGRSYGRATRVLAVGLPGIVNCGLWRDLSAAPALPTTALVTDIGNDLIYEEPVERITGWLETCFDRLAAIGARTLVTRLPIDNVLSLSAARFHLFRRLLFPASRISQAEITRRAVALDEVVARLAAERGMATAAHRTSWYGLDPIHIRYSRRAEAWREIFSAYGDASDSLTPAGAAILRSLALRVRTPHERQLLWLTQRGRQPLACFRDGTSVSMY